MAFFEQTAEFVDVSLWSTENGCLENTRSMGSLCVVNIVMMPSLPAHAHIKWTKRIQFPAELIFVSPDELSRQGQLIGMHTA